MKTQEWPDQPGKGMMRIKCDGCGTWHTIYTRLLDSHKPHPVWSFNGDLSNPTFSPSVRITWPENGKDHCCHFIITNGQIQFCGDCTHSLAGQTLTLPEI